MKCLRKILSLDLKNYANFSRSIESVAQNFQVFQVFRTTKRTESGSLLLGDLPAKMCTGRPPLRTTAIVD